MKTPTKKGKVERGKAKALGAEYMGLLTLLRQWVSFDGGNGGAKLAFYDQRGLIQRLMLPHARIRVSGQTVKGRAGGKVSVPYADFAGDRWGFTDAIFDLATDQPVDVFQNSAERYGTPEHVFYLLLLMALANTPDMTEINLIISVPPGLFNRVADRVVEGFQRGSVKVREIIVNPGKKNERVVDEEYFDGWWEIKLFDQREARSYKFNEVIVVMEGADPGYNAFRHNLMGEVVELPGDDGQDLLGGRCRIGDAGYGTFDFPTLVDGLLIEDDIDRASDSQGGILIQICQPILDKIKDRVPDATLNTAHIEKFLRDYANGKTEGGKKIAAWTDEAATVTVQSVAIPLKKQFDHYIEQYARYVWANHVLAAVRQNIDVYVAIGGGWLFIIGHIRRLIQEAGIKMKLVSIWDVDHLQQFSPIDINSVGMLVMTAVFLKAQAEEEAVE